MKILCKVTSRERPENLLKCVKSYIDLKSCENELIWLFSFDKDDTQYNSPVFLFKLSEILKDLKTENIVFGYSKSKIDAINRDVNKVEDWDILVNISDDQLSIKKDWDKIIVSKMPCDLDASLWFNDGHQDVLNTQEIIGRKYYERFNYIYYHEYKSFFCDNEAQDVAFLLGKIIKVNECIIKHFHPIWEKETHMDNDDLYKRQNVNWGFDKVLYNTRKSLNYGL